MKQLKVEMAPCGTQYKIHASSFLACKTLLREKSGQTFKGKTKTGTLLLANQTENTNTYIDYIAIIRYLFMLALFAR